MLKLIAVVPLLSGGGSFALSGIAKVRTYTADGEEVVMSLLGEGEVFGEMAALDGAPRSADVVALTPVRCLLLEAPDAQDFFLGDYLQDLLSPLFPVVMPAHE